MNARVGHTPNKGKKIYAAKKRATQREISKAMREKKKKEKKREKRNHQ